MGRFINKGFVRLGEVGPLGASIITGANLSPKKPKSAPPATPAKAAKAARPAASKAK